VTKRNDAGFTIIETLVAVVISTMMIGAITQVAITGMRTLDDTNSRIAGSNDTQLVAGYFTSDVASAETLSTTGATLHSAPSVTTTAPNALVIGFWSLKGGTSLTPPSGMGENWDLASTGPTAASRVTVSMADDAIAPDGATGDWIADSANGTSSITHTVALAPASATAIARRGVSTGSTGAGATSLTLSPPLLTQSQDRLLAQIAVSGTTVNTPAGWTVVASRTVGTITSVIFSHAAITTDPLNWAWTFNGPGESAGGIVGYSGVSAGVSAVNAFGSDVNPCGGSTPVLLLSWRDRGSPQTSHEVAYNYATTGGESVLTRSHCTASSGTPRDVETLARNLSGATPAFAACQPATCSPSASPVYVTLTLTEPPPAHETSGRTYQLRGSTRTTS
jgi:Tfp pilus assembly protein PilV